MSKSLFKITNEYFEIEQMLDASGGELTPEMEKLIEINVDSSILAKSTTAEIFNSLISQYNVPSNKQFALLSRLRLAKSFATKDGRVDAVKRRLEALITVLQIHNNGDVLAGYFQAQVSCRLL